MKYLKKILMILFVALLIASPSFAARQFFSVNATGASSAEADIRSDAHSLVLTHLAVKTDLSTAKATVMGHICDSGMTTLSAATTAAQAVLSVNSTTEFSAGEYIFIEDRLDRCDFESAEIASVGTSTITLVQNLSHGYPINSPVYEIKTVARFAPEATTEAVYKESMNLASVPAGSPMSIWLTGTNTCEISAAGYVAYGQ